MARYKSIQKKELKAISVCSIPNEWKQSVELLSNQKSIYYRKYKIKDSMRLFFYLNILLALTCLLFYIYYIKKQVTINISTWEIIYVIFMTILWILLIFSVVLDSSRYKRAWKSCELEMSRLMNGAEKYQTWEKYLNEKDEEIKTTNKTNKKTRTKMISSTENKNTTDYTINRENNRENLKEFVDVTIKNAEKTVENIQKVIEKNKSDEPLEKVKKQFLNIKTCIITTLPEEFAALKALLKNVDFLDEETFSHTDLSCCFGEVCGANGTSHIIGLFLFPDNDFMTIDEYSGKLSSVFYQLKHIIYCGIAGGVPQVTNIGDVVISTDGVFQYNESKHSENTFVIRDFGTNCDSFLKQGVTLFRALEYENNSPWKRYMDDIGKKLNSDFATPPEKKVPYWGKNESENEYELKEKECPALPCSHYGRISSGDYIQNDPRKRDYLYQREKVIAIMGKETHIHDSRSYQNINYLMICGINDFCDQAIETPWNKYAVATAASYTIGLLESMRHF